VSALLGCRGAGGAGGSDGRADRGADRGADGGAGGRDEGWILFDLLIGAVVLTAGLLATTLVFNQSQQSSTRVSDHAEAVALTTSLLAQATAYGCGAETGLSFPGAAAVGAAAGYPSTVAIWRQCAELYTGDATLPFAGVLGDPVTRPLPPTGAAAAWQEVLGGTEFSVSYRATWVAGTGGGCPPATPGSAGSPAPAPMPIGQTRTVRVAWTDHGGTTTFAVTAFGGVPIDAAVYSFPDAGGIVVTGMAAGSMARLAVPVSLFDPGVSGVVLLDRAASAGGCAWFPFLLPAGPGGYSVRYYSDGDASGPPSATSPSSLAVPADTLARWVA
jgi:hypothetical protein